MTVEPEAPRRGLVLAIGGAEDKTRSRSILRTFVDAAGGFEANIVILATASELATTGERYAEIFQSLEADSVEVIDVKTREEALHRMEASVDSLEYASGLFMTGGNQLRLSTILGGTPLADTIRRRSAAGMVVAGTSAGAAVLSEHMIAFGQSGGTPQRRRVQLAAGLGLVPEIVIDQHFRQRDRLGRLMTATSFNPRLLGVGIDEDTAIVITPDDSFSVLGSGSVTIVDASRMTWTSVDAVGSSQPIALLGLRVDVLTAGCRYAFSERRAEPPRAGAEPPRAIEEPEPEAVHEDS